MAAAVTSLSCLGRSTEGREWEGSSGWAMEREAGGGWRLSERDVHALAIGCGVLGTGEQPARQAVRQADGRRGARAEVLSAMAGAWQEAEAARTWPPSSCCEPCDTRKGGREGATRHVLPACRASSPGMDVGLDRRGVCVMAGAGVHWWLAVSGCRTRTW